MGRAACAKPFVWATDAWLRRQGEAGGCKPPFSEEAVIWRDSSGKISITARRFLPVGWKGCLSEDQL